MRNIKLISSGRRNARQESKSIQRNEEWWDYESDKLDIHRCEIYYV